MHLQIVCIFKLPAYYTHCFRFVNPYSSIIKSCFTLLQSCLHWLSGIVWQQLLRLRPTSILNAPLLVPKL